MLIKKYIKYLIFEFQNNFKKLRGVFMIDHHLSVFYISIFENYWYRWMSDYTYLLSTYFSVAYGYLISFSLIDLQKKLLKMHKKARVTLVKRIRTVLRVWGVIFWFLLIYYSPYVELKRNDNGIREGYLTVVVYRCCKNLLRSRKLLESKVIYNKEEWKLQNSILYPSIKINVYDFFKYKEFKKARTFKSDGCRYKKKDESKFLKKLTKDCIKKYLKLFYAKFKKTPQTPKEEHIKASIYEVWKNRILRFNTVNKKNIKKNKKFIVIKSLNVANFIVINIITIYNFFKSTLIPAILTVLFVLYNLLYFQLPILQYLSIWVVLGFLFLWLISGFNFFLKKYRYGKYTSAIQRFWKRTNLLFWFIEFFLFFLFFYYYLNSSSEPTFMFDDFYFSTPVHINFYSAIYSIFYICIIIFLLYCILLSLSFLSTPQQYIYIFIVSVCIYTLFIYETYQFYYLITSFKELYWDLNVDLDKKGVDNIWSLESCEVEDKQYNRVKFYYFTLCLIAKYWHFIFIIISWFFFCMKGFELKKFTYTAISYNLQNFSILFVLNLLCYIDLLKWVIHQLIEFPFFWFFTNYDLLLFLNLIEEVLNLIFSLFSNNLNLIKITDILIVKNIWVSNSLFDIINIV